MNKPKEPTMMISGGMKTNKSWTALEISLSIATGGEWLGFQCARGNVLHIDSELSEYTFHHRITSLRKGMGISKMPMGSLRALRLAGEVCEIDKLSEELIAKYKPGDLSAIVIDPIYVMLGNREENRNEHMKEIGLIMGRIAKMTGAAVIFVHHHAKGEQKGKRAIERASGGGALGRFVSTSMDIAMQKHDKFKFEFTVRDYRSPDAFLAIRAIPGPTWERLSEPVGEEDGDEGLNENDVKKVADLVETNEKISQAKWFERARAAGFGRPTFEEILEWLAENGIATNEPGPRRSKLWSFPARKGERFESQFED